jgi:DNA-binding transcriptional ArsR family regulator
MHGRWVDGKERVGDAMHDLRMQQRPGAEVDVDVVGVPARHVQADRRKVGPEQNLHPHPFETWRAGSIGKWRLTDVLTDEATDPWGALANGTRRAIFKRLAGGPMAVGEFAQGLPVSRPAVSQHLKVLKCAGLVADRAVGTRRVYHVDRMGIEALRAELEVFWGAALDAFKLVADEEGEGK